MVLLRRGCSGSAHGKRKSTKLLESSEKSSEKRGNQSVTNCNQLKLKAADGKFYKTDVADQEQLFRLIQSIPSPKAEPFKMWMAKVATERLDQIQDPELSIQQAVADYRRLGYSERWIARRLKSIGIHKDLTDEWKARGVEDEREYASLTNTIYKTWAGMTAGEYKRFKGFRSPSRFRCGSREVLQCRWKSNVLRGLGIVKIRLV